MSRQLSSSEQSRRQLSSELVGLRGQAREAESWQKEKQVCGGATITVKTDHCTTCLEKGLEVPITNSMTSCLYAHSSPFYVVMLSASVQCFLNQPVEVC